MADGKKAERKGAWLKKARPAHLRPKRTVQITVRLNQAEYDTLAQMAIDRGVGISELVRQKVIG